ERNAVERRRIDVDQAVAFANDMRARRLEDHVTTTASRRRLPEQFRPTLLGLAGRLGVPERLLTADADGLSLQVTCACHGLPSCPKGGNGFSETAVDGICHLTRLRHV